MRKIHDFFKIYFLLTIIFLTPFSLNAQQASGFQFFPLIDEADISSDNEPIAEVNKAPIVFGYFTFISDMEGAIWLESKEYPVEPNQPTENLPVPKSFKYSFVTKDKVFITQELGKKIHPAKKGENDTIFLAIKNDFEHFVKKTKEAKISALIFDEINHGMIPIDQHVEMSKYEVTYQQYAQFIFETGYRKEESTIDASLIIKHFSSFTNQRAMQAGISWKHDPNGKLIEEEEKSLNYPIINVSWHEAQQFCQWLSSKKGEYLYRLPTVQEWEKAAAQFPVKNWTEYANLADTTLQTLLPNKSNKEVSGAYNDNYALTNPVGTYKANPLGLFDMYGNVAEWVQDDLKNPNIQEHRKIIKGGSYFILPDKLIHKNTYGYNPSKRHAGIGFRVVRERVGKAVYSHK